MVMLEEDEYFSLSGYVESPGEVRTVLKGFLVSRRNGETYVAPLLPQLFYGASGQQLRTWRQTITQPGEQVLLSRSGGYPKVPKEELYWRKVAKRVAPTAPRVAGDPYLLLKVLAIGVFLFLVTRR